MLVKQLSLEICNEGERQGGPGCFIGCEMSGSDDAHAADRQRAVTGIPTSGDSRRFPADSATRKDAALNEKTAARGGRRSDQNSSNCPVVLRTAGTSSGRWKRELSSSR
jgi:hypothetical protein